MFYVAMTQKACVDFKLFLGAKDAIKIILIIIIIYVYYVLSFKVL